MVLIEVLDVNDNPPKFDNAIYNESSLFEEEPGISRNNPKYLLTVSDRFLPFQSCFAMATTGLYNIL